MNQDWRHHPSQCPWRVIVRINRVCIYTIVDDPFLNFVSSYSNYINDSENTTLDLDKVFTTLNETVKLQKP